jgi:hypothetical protein
MHVVNINMGCGMSSKHPARDAPVLTVMSPDTYKELLLIGLCEKEVHAFQRVFYECVMDDVSHATGLQEIMLYFNLNGPLPKRICQFFLHQEDLKNSDRIGIRQFIIHSWWYLSMDQQALAEFSFDIFHVSKHEKGLTYNDIYEMLEIVQSKSIKGSTIHDKIINILTIFYPGKANEDYLDSKIIKGLIISRFEYMSKIQQFSALLYPIFEIQHCMRVKVLGSHHWKALEKNAVQVKKRPEVVKLLVSRHQGAEKEALLHNFGHKPTNHTLEASHTSAQGSKYETAPSSHMPFDSQPSSGNKSDGDDKGGVATQHRGGLTKHVSSAEGIPAGKHHAQAQDHIYGSGHGHPLGTGKNAAFDQHLPSAHHAPAYAITSKAAPLVVSSAKAITELKRVTKYRDTNKADAKGRSKAATGTSTLHEVSLISPGGAPYVEGHGAPAAGLGFETAAAIGTSHHGRPKKSAFF